MNVERFDHIAHIPILRRWLEARGMPDKGGEDWYAATGLYVGQIAFGFVYLTNSRVAYLDNYITDPGSNLEDRRHALEVLTLGLCALAKARGYEFVCTATSVPTIPPMYERCGFTLDERPFTWAGRRL